MQTFRVLRASLTLEKPWFPVASGWIELETGTGAVMVEKAPKTGLCQLVET